MANENENFDNLEFDDLPDFSDFAPASEDKSNPNPPSPEEEEEDDDVGPLLNDLLDTPDDDDDDQDDDDDEEDEDDDEPTYGEDADEIAIGTYDALVSMGMLPKDEEFDGTFDKLEEYFRDIPNRAVNALVEQMPENGQAFLQYLFAKGENLTDNDLKDFISTYIDSGSSPEINTGNLEEVKSFILEDYQSKMSKVAAQAAVDALEDEDEDGTALKAELDRIQKNQKESPAYKAKLQEAEAEKRKIEKAQKEFVSSVAKTIEDKNWKEARKNLVKNSLRGNNISNTLNAVMNDPDAFVELANILTYYDSKTNTFDFKAFAAQAGSSEVRKKKDNIIADAFSSSSSKTKGKTKKKTGKNIIDFLDPVF